MLHDWQSDKHYCRESEEVLMSMIKETKTGKYILYDSKGKIIIISRDKRVVRLLKDKLLDNK